MASVFHIFKVSLLLKFKFIFRIQVALQQKCNDLAHTQDKVARTEAQAKQFHSEVVSLRTELKTKQEIIHTIKDKNKVLEVDALEKKQLGKEVESLRAQTILREQEKSKLQTQIDELAAR